MYRRKPAPGICLHVHAQGCTVLGNTVNKGTMYTYYTKTDFIYVGVKAAASNARYVTLIL